MFNNILFYLVIGLSASTMGFGYLSYSLKGVNAELELGLVQVIDVNTGLVKSLNLRDLSCKQDIDSTVELETEKKDLNDRSDVITQEISNLPFGVKKPTNNIITEAPKNAEESHVLNGNELLSDDLRKLLLQSYCNIEPSDQQCLSP